MVTPNESPQPIHGGCLCGGTRYVLSAPPVSLGDCHCVDCRRSAGAPFVTWGTVDRKDLEITSGTVRRVDFAGRVRVFAGCCGTHLFFEDPRFADAVDVTIASLDDPAPYRPAKAIWTEDKLPWVILDPTIPAYLRSSAEAQRTES